MPWTSSGVLSRLNTKLHSRESPPRALGQTLAKGDIDYVPPPPDSRRTSTVDTSAGDMRWEDGVPMDEMDMEMLTEVMEGGEVDEEVRENVPMFFLHYTVSL